MTGLKRNRLKRALGERRLQIGLWCTIADPLVAELAAASGFDWLMFDTEHAPIDAVSVLPLLQAAAAYPVSPVVRPGSLNAAEIKKLLDIGAQSILVPMIGSAEEAAAAVAAVTYPPAGIRGVSGVTRASGFGTVPGYHRQARDEICLIVQIETLAGLEALEAICAVEGVDAVFVGPADLAGALGHPGQPGHPQVKETVLEAVARIVAAGRPAGLLTPDADLLAAAARAGAVFVSGDVDMAALRDALKAGKGHGLRARLTDEKR